MRLHEPIAGFRNFSYPTGDVTQYFGENPALYQNCCKLAGHNGWDIVRAWGTPILCVEAGKVVEVNERVDGNGKYIRILCASGEWIYGHLSVIGVTLGQQIAAGAEIGKMGNTGFVISGPTPYWKYNPYAGTHLHITHYPGTPNPASGANRYYPTGDKMRVNNPDNGYFGAEDLKDVAFYSSAASYEPLKASDQVALFAARKMALGESAAATTLFALAAFLRAFGY